MSNIKCSACDVLYVQDGDLYFNRVAIVEKKDAKPLEVYTCHTCLQFYYETIIPDLIKTYKGDTVTCQVKNSIKTKQDSTFFRLLRLLKLRG